MNAQDIIKRNKIQRIQNYYMYMYVELLTLGLHFSEYKEVQQIVAVTLNPHLVLTLLLGVGAIRIEEESCLWGVVAQWWG